MSLLMPIFHRMKIAVLPARRIEGIGRRLSCTLLTNDGNENRRDLGVARQQCLGVVGIDVKPVQMAWGVLLARMLAPNLDFDAVTLGWVLGLDPDPGKLWHSHEIAQGFNYIAFDNPLAEPDIHIRDRTERAR